VHLVRGVEYDGGGELRNCHIATGNHALAAAVPAGLAATSLELGDDLCSLKQMLHAVWGTLVTRQQGIRLAVIYEFFRPDVPGDRSSELHRDPAHDAGGPSAMGDSRRRDRAQCSVS
jgi:hypothetical protein